MFILKKGHQPGVYVPLRALFLVLLVVIHSWSFIYKCTQKNVPDMGI